MPHVYHSSGRSWGVAVAGLVLVLLPAVFARQLIKKQGTGHRSKVNPLDRLAIGLDSEAAESLGNWTTGLGIAAPFAIDVVDTAGHPEAFFEDAIVIGQALALNGALNTAVKYTVQRPLPETYAGEVPNRRGKPRGYRAFYSGHVSALATSLVAGCMSVRLRHGRLPLRWPWLVSATLTGLVGAARVFSGKHYPTDVVVGAMAGTAIGAAVPMLHALAKTRPHAAVVLVRAARAGRVGWERRLSGGSRGPWRWREQAQGGSSGEGLGRGDSRDPCSSHLRAPRTHAPRTCRPRARRGARPATRRRGLPSARRADASTAGSRPGGPSDELQARRDPRSPYYHLATSLLIPRFHRMDG
jgi:membrane-associated phospholipid phosphatase